MHRASLHSFFKKTYESKVNSLKLITKEMSSQFVAYLGKEMNLNKLDANVQMNHFIFHKKGMEKELNFVKTDFDLSFIKDKILLSNLSSAHKPLQSKISLIFL